MLNKLLRNGVDDLDFLRNGYDEYGKDSKYRGPCYSGDEYQDANHDICYRTGICYKKSDFEGIDEVK